MDNSVATSQQRDDSKYLSGLNYARSLNFTDKQYDEAIKMIDSPENANQLLVALIDVSSRCSSSSRINVTNTDESSTSCYSSITSFNSSSTNSLESLQLKRKIYIDGSNVARSHGKYGNFSWLGIKICVDWFLARQHRVKVFVPNEKCITSNHNTNDSSFILNFLNNNNILIQTPSGCNDDLFIIEAAKQSSGVIVSNDLYRDEKRFNEELEQFIKFNRLPYVFDDDLFLPAADPLGRSGPTLEEFLKEVPNQLQQQQQPHTKIQRSRSRYSNINYNQQNTAHQHQAPTRRANTVHTPSCSNTIHHHNNANFLSTTISNRANRKALQRTKSHQ